MKYDGSIKKRPNEYLITRSNGYTFVVEAATPHTAARKACLRMLGTRHQTVRCLDREKGIYQSFVAKRLYRPHVDGDGHLNEPFQVTLHRRWR